IWKSNTGKSIKEYFEENIPGYGNRIVKSYMNSIMEFAQASLGIKSINQDELIPLMMGEESVIFSTLLRHLPEEEKDDEKLKKVIAYLQSKKVQKLPFNEIYSALWAAIAYQAGTGGRVN